MRFLPYTFRYQGCFYRNNALRFTIDIEQSFYTKGLWTLKFSFWRYTAYTKLGITDRRLKNEPRT